MMKPIPRTMGHFLSFHDVPFCIDSIVEYIQKMWDHDASSEKKLRNPPSPAQIIKDSLDFGLLLPSLEQRATTSKLGYRISSDLCRQAEFIAPYFFEPNLHIKVLRAFANLTPSFGYGVYVTNSLEIISTETGFLYVPTEGFHFQFDYGESGTVLFNDQSMYFAHGQLLLRSASDCPVVISASGAFCFRIKGVPHVIHADGAISHYAHGKWLRYDKDGLEPNGTRTKPAKIVNPQTGVAKVVRPDNIEYYVLPDGKRKIVIDEDSYVEQDPVGSIEISVSSAFPVITVSNSGFGFELESFTVTLSKECDAKVTCPSYTLEVSGDTAVLVIGESEVRMNSTSCQVKSPDKVFICDKAGNEKVGTIMTEAPANKKKMALLPTFWGPLLPMKETLPEPQQLSLHQLFRPHFVAIRSDFTATEFLRPDCVDTTDYTEFQTDIPLPEGETIKLLSFHNVTDPPLAISAFEPMAKTTRSNLLKNLHLPKAAKKKPGESDDTKAMAEEADKKSLDTRHLIAGLITAATVRAQGLYFESISEPEIPPPVRLPVPPPTLRPRLLKMAHCKRSSGTAVNYWGVPESEFAFADGSSSGRAAGFSPRTLLFDPPRYFTLAGSQFPRRATEEAFVTQDTAFVPRTTGSSVPPPEEISRMLVRDGPHIIDFGDVSIGEKRVVSLVFQNKGKRPVHYRCSKLTCPGLSMLSIGGVVFPGLRASVKLMLHAVEAGMLIDGFQLSTVFGEVSVPVMANVLPAESNSREGPEVSGLTAKTSAETNAG
jgi:hypothetical protein